MFGFRKKEEDLIAKGFFYIFGLPEYHNEMRYMYNEIAKRCSDRYPLSLYSTMGMYEHKQNGIYPDLDLSKMSSVRFDSDFYKYRQIIVDKDNIVLGIEDFGLYASYASNIVLVFDNVEQLGSSPYIDIVNLLQERKNHSGSSCSLSLVSIRNKNIMEKVINDIGGSNENDM